MGYNCQLGKGRLSLTLIHINFSVEMHRKWDCRIDFPCWDKLIAAVTEMALARCEINLTAGISIQVSAISIHAADRRGTGDLIAELPLLVRA